MTNLRALYLDGNAVSDLTPLANLTALEELTLRNNPLTGLEPLRGSAADAAAGHLPPRA